MDQGLVFVFAVVVGFFCCCCFKTKQEFEAGAENEEDFPFPIDSNLYMSSGRQHALKMIFFIYGKVTTLLPIRLILSLCPFVVVPLSIYTSHDFCTLLFYL